VKYATLYSPIDGIVTNVEQPITGINITPATAEFIIIDPQSVYFDSEIDEDEVNQIKVGQKATITIDSFSEESINSKITYISFTPKAGESSTTYQVKFELNNDNQFLKYRIGMNGDAIISIRESKNTLTLPIEAINQNEKETYVYIKKEGSNKELEKRIIKTGIESDDDIEILDGISKSDSVVIKGE
ncbi:efflux RND transporter periplasmic adaptor subunit, partial [Patescibacteria group bacterium]|nr:efflux RND transporter periplasmic adaptor subunit [Patescibacteria group bacterium]